MLTLLAPAKINLYLHITGKRDDGYHLLDTVFQRIDLCDTVTLSVRQDGRVALHTPIAGLPDAQHLAVRAAVLLQQHVRCSFGADIWVDKRIPSGAGLGGGSSDAASVLNGLNRLWGCGLNPQHLQTLGLQLGADVPFFCSPFVAARATGVGEQLQGLASSAKAYVVVFPAAHVHTPEVFKHPHLKWPERAQLGALEGDTYDCFGGDFGNDLQVVAQHIAPVIVDACAWLGQAPLVEGVRMSGSGSAVFAQFSNLKNAQNALQYLQENVLQNRVQHSANALPWQAWAVNAVHEIA